MYISPSTKNNDLDHPDIIAQLIELYVDKDNRMLNVSVIVSYILLIV